MKKGRNNSIGGLNSASSVSDNKKSIVLFLNRRF